MSQHLAVTLSPETRQQLLDMTRKGNAPARVQNRARILLLADKNQETPKTQEQIAQALSVCHPTVGKICRSFVQAGIESALYEKPRPGKSPKITGDVETQLIPIRFVATTGVIRLSGRSLRTQRLPAALRAGRQHSPAPPASGYPAHSRRLLPEGRMTPNHMASNHRFGIRWR